jgi:methyl coenzyme M reductase beta subunit
LQSKLGTATVIQLNDHIVTVDELRDELTKVRQMMSDEDCDRMVVSIRADRKTELGIIADVKRALREAGALRVNYSAIDTNEQYDALYLANMVKADFWGSSIEDEEHMARYIENVICDPDGYDGLVFNRFLADCSGKGVVIFWEQMIHSAW